MSKLVISLILSVCIQCSSPTKSETNRLPVVEKEYQVILSEIGEKQALLAAIYSENRKKQVACIQEARSYLLKRLSQEIFPSWYGTPWDFNGTTRTPRKGKIACGYFVTTVINDIGFDIPRVKWAQQASEYFIKRMAEDDIKRYTNESVKVIEKSIQARGDGLYIVGLDSHVGFILVEDGESLFIHSDYYDREIGVMAEVLDSDNPLKDSNYHVIGKILSDDMIRNWLTGSRYVF